MFNSISDVLWCSDLCSQRNNSSDKRFVLLDCAACCHFCRLSVVRCCMKNGRKTVTVLRKYVLLLCPMIVCVCPSVRTGGEAKEMNNWVSGGKFTDWSSIEAAKLLWAARVARSSSFMRRYTTQ